MLPIEYSDWKTVWSQLLIQKRSRKQVNLQWYSFSCLSKIDKDFLQSEKFFQDYIQSGFVFFHADVWFVSDNYLMKSDGNFRHASLVSPIMYLVMLAIGKHISKRYIPARQKSIDVFYAGNFAEDRLSYHKDYDMFHKRINEIADDRQYFIKTDIKDFFPNININQLFSYIDDNLQKNSASVCAKMMWTKESKKEKLKMV